MSGASTSRSGVFKLWLLNLLGNAAILASWYWWLLIPDAHRWQVAWTVVQALLTIAFVLWLRAGSVAWFRVSEFRTQEALAPAFRRGWRHALPLAIWFAVFAVAAWIIISAGNYAPQFSVWIRQKVNAGPTPRNVMRDTDRLLFALLWIVLPAVWIPIATTIAVVGLSGAHIRRSLRVLRQPVYWLLFCLLMALAAWVPYKLVTWVPELSTLQQQVWSAGLRFVAAYIVMITAGLGLMWVAGERTDREDPID